MKKRHGAEQLTMEVSVSCYSTCCFVECVLHANWRLPLSHDGRKLNNPPLLLRESHLWAALYLQASRSTSVSIADRTDSDKCGQAEKIL